MARIFFVDDDLASELLVENLRQRGHEVQRLSSADDALREVARLAESDLVVLDLLMPRLTDVEAETPDGLRCTGMLVYQALRRINPELPLLVFTANQDPAPREVIAEDTHATYVSRWSSPTLKEFVAIIYGMLGIKPAVRVPRPFIVHGHDDKAKFELKNYLQNTLHLPEPIVLHEQPDMGRTIIEKFEDLASDVELAFVLLTPDDRVAGPAERDSEKRRGRQNVVLELGFFLGALGRQSGRVFLLHKGDLEIPSDLSGVIYINIENGIESIGERIRKEIAAIHDNDERPSEHYV